MSWVRLLKFELADPLPVGWSLALSRLYVELILEQEAIWGNRITKAQENLERK